MFNYKYMNNALIYGLIFGLILAPGFIGIELRFFSFLVRLFRLNIKFNRPAEVLALLITELISFFIGLKALLVIPSLYAVLVILFLFVKVFALWNMKKWVLYAYPLFILLPIINGGLFQVNNIWLNIASVVSQVLVLLIYYLFVYQPNQKEFK